MMGTVVGSTPSWVGDATVWFGLFISLGTLAGIFYAFTRFAVKLFTGQVSDVIDAKVPCMIDAALEPVKKDLQHVHDCVERTGKEATTAAGEARDAVRNHSEMMEDHIAADAVAFQAAADWQRTADIALSNIQAAQAPHTT